MKSFLFVFLRNQYCIVWAYAEYKRENIRSARTACRSTMKTYTPRNIQNYGEDFKFSMICL